MSLIILSIFALASFALIKGLPLDAAPNSEGDDVGDGDGYGVVDNVVERLRDVLDREGASVGDVVRRFGVVAAK